MAELGFKSMESVSRAHVLGSQPVAGVRITQDLGTNTKSQVLSCFGRPGPLCSLLAPRGFRYQSMGGPALCSSALIWNILHRLLPCLRACPVPTGECFLACAQRRKSCSSPARGPLGLSHSLLGPRNPPAHVPGHMGVTSTPSGVPLWRLLSSHYLRLT